MSNHRIMVSPNMSLPSPLTLSQNESLPSSPPAPNRSASPSRILSFTIQLTKLYNFFTTKVNLSKNVFNAVLFSGSCSQLRIFLMRVTLINQPKNSTIGLRNPFNQPKYFPAIPFCLEVGFCAVFDCNDLSSSAASSASWSLSLCSLLLCACSASTLFAADLTAICLISHATLPILAIVLPILLVAVIDFLAAKSAGVSLPFTPAFTNLCVNLFATID